MKEFPSAPKKGENEQDVAVARLERITESTVDVVQRLESCARPGEISLLKDVAMSAGGMRHIVEMGGVRGDTMDAIEAMERHISALKQKYPHAFRPKIIRT